MGRGQWMAFVVALSGMVLSALLVYSGHFVSGAIFGGAELATLVGVFLKQQNDKNKPQSEK